MLSESMKKTLDFLKEKEILYKYMGGYWAEQGLSHDDFSDPYKNKPDHVSTRSLKALERRGLVNFTDFEDRGHGEVPVRVEAT